MNVEKRKEKRAPVFRKQRDTAQATKLRTRICHAMRWPTKPSYTALACDGDRLQVDDLGTTRLTYGDLFQCPFSDLLV